MIDHHHPALIKNGSEDKVCRIWSGLCWDLTLPFRTG